MNHSTGPIFASVEDSYLNQLIDCIVNSMAIRSAETKPDGRVVTVMEGDCTSRLAKAYHPLAVARLEAIGNSKTLIDLHLGMLKVGTNRKDSPEIIMRNILTSISAIALGLE